MFIAMSVYEMGYAAGTAALTGLGIWLIVNGAKRLQSSKKLPPVTPTSLSAQPLPATSGAPGNDFFFAGAVSASPPPPPGGTDTHWDAADPAAGLRAQPVKSSSNVAAVVMVIVGVGLASCALFQGYQQFFPHGRTIEMPDEILGMERIDPDSDLGRQLEASRRQLPTLPGGEELQSAAYISGGGVLLVAAGESASSDAEVDDFFAGFGTEMTQVAPEITLGEVDPGPLGGNMRCAANNTQAIGACVWVDQDTVGVVFVAAPDLDLADTARQAREAVEH